MTVVITEVFDFEDTTVGGTVPPTGQSLTLGSHDDAIVVDHPVFSGARAVYSTGTYGNTSAGTLPFRTPSYPSGPTYSTLEEWYTNVYSFIGTYDDFLAALDGAFGTHDPAVVIPQLIAINVSERQAAWDHVSWWTQLVSPPLAGPPPSTFSNYYLEVALAQFDNFEVGMHDSRQDLTTTTTPAAYYVPYTVGLYVRYYTGSADFVDVGWDFPPDEWVQFKIAFTYAPLAATLEVRSTSGALLFSMPLTLPDDGSINASMTLLTMPTSDYNVGFVVDLVNTAWYAPGTVTPGVPAEMTATTRLYPRDDGQGIAPSPRVYPPTRAKRVIGGYGDRPGPNGAPGGGFTTG